MPTTNTIPLGAAKPNLRNAAFREARKLLETSLDMPTHERRAEAPP